MKPFKFDEVDKRLNKKSKKQVQQQKMRQNFLRLYDDIPTDTKMERFCNQVMNRFDERRKNNRYYTYELNKQAQSKTNELRTEEIKKLSLYQMPYKPEAKQKQIEDQLAKSQKLKMQNARKMTLKLRFRKNIKLIILKMKKLKINMKDIFDKQLFSKQPYKFGSQIFTATKQGNTQKVWRLMIQNKFSIFSIDNSNKTILFWASIRGYHKILKMCIDWGMDIDKGDIYGLTPLNYAIKYNNQQCVKVLMLELANCNNSHQQDSKKASQKVRNIINVALGLKKLFKRMSTQQRNQLFQQQYLYLYK